jgi:hypothetical protein
LRNAERIALLGYSLPSTDHMTFGLLQSVQERHDGRLDVVNLNVKELMPRSKALVGITRRGRLPWWVHRYEGIDAIESYTMPGLKMRLQRPPRMHAYVSFASASAFPTTSLRERRSVFASIAERRVGNTASGLLDWDYRASLSH